MVGCWGRSTLPYCNGSSLCSYWVVVVVVVVVVRSCIVGCWVNQYLPTFCPQPLPKSHHMDSSPDLYLPNPLALPCVLLSIILSTHLSILISIVLRSIYYCLLCGPFDSDVAGSIQPLSSIIHTHRFVLFLAHTYIFSLTYTYTYTYRAFYLSPHCLLTGPFYQKVVGSIPSLSTFLSSRTNSSVCFFIV